MKNKIKLGWFLLCVIIGCNNDNNLKDLSSFPEQYNLEGTKITQGIVFSGGQIDICDSLLIVTSTPNNDKCIHFYNKKTLEYISSTGILGRGPGEINNPAQCAIDKNKKIIWYRDYARQCIWKFDIKHALGNPNYLPTDKIPMPEDHFFIFFKYENDSLFSFGNIDQNKLLSFFNYKGMVIDSLTIPNTINFYSSDISEFTRMSRTIYFYEKDKQTGSYIFAFRYANVLAKVKKEKNYKTEVVIDSGNTFPTPDHADRSQATYNDCLKVCNSFSFTLYLGKPWLNLTADYHDVNYSNTINVYDRNLEPFAQLLLNHTANWFEIDIENERIITSSPDTGYMVYYSIPPELLKKIKI